MAYINLFYITLHTTSNKQYEPENVDEKYTTVCPSETSHTFTYGNLAQHEATLENT